MGVIRELPASVVNQIAAGEVVERPASVVKELLENAIDAGATRVDVSVERGGKDLVRIADNGVGMAPDDLALAFQPHATSKLADVETCIECARSASAARRWRRSPRSPGSAVRPAKPSGRGSEIPSRPDRRADQELRLPAGHGHGSAQPLLQHTGAADVPEVRHDRGRSRRRDVHPDRPGPPRVHSDVPLGGQDRPRPAAGDGNARADRDLLRPRAGRVVALGRGQLDKIYLWGYVAHPSQSRSSNKGQFLFLGGRYVRDRSLGHALGEAYRGLLMVGRNPVAFLHLEMPPEEVDVNVHPTKIEVRFRDPQRVYSHLLSTLRQTFLASDLHSRLAGCTGAASGAVSPAPEPGLPC